MHRAGHCGFFGCPRESSWPWGRVHGDGPSVISKSGWGTAAGDTKWEGDEVIYCSLPHKVLLIRFKSLSYIVLCFLWLCKYSVIYLSPPWLKYTWGCKEYREEKPILRISPFWPMYLVLPTQTYGKLWHLLWFKFKMSPKGSLIQRWDFWKALDHASTVLIRELTYWRAQSRVCC